LAVVSREASSSSLISRHEEEEKEEEEQEEEEEEFEDNNDDDDEDEEGNDDDNDGNALARDGVLLWIGCGRSSIVRSFPHQNDTEKLLSRLFTKCHHRGGIYSISPSRRTPSNPFAV
jgi:hypothetical protein